jgi:hypothetical protein
MSEPDSTPESNALAFIAKWQASIATELASAQTFVAELCDLLDLPKPDPAGDGSYTYEKPLTQNLGDGSSTPRRIDCYKRGCFILEAKKLKKNASSKGFDVAMLQARAQAENYARALPAAEGRPPFLIVVDVGHVFELYAEFSRTGGTYTPFPDPRHHRLPLQSLADAATRELLRAVWTQPDSLDPAKRSAKVTREVSDALAGLATSLEADGHAPKTVAAFLTRCLFSMFAEDVELLPKGAFLGLLEQHKAESDTLSYLTTTPYNIRLALERFLNIKFQMLREHASLELQSSWPPLRGARQTRCAQCAACLPILTTRSRSKAPSHPTRCKAYMTCKPQGSRSSPSPGGLLAGLSPSPKLGPCEPSWRKTAQWFG